MLKDRLKEARIKKGLKQDEAAKQLNIPLGTYRNYEQGIHGPDNETLVKIANFYNISTDYLLGRKEPVSPFAEDIDELIRIIEKLPEDEQKRIAMAIVKNL
jgi:transcriptional regulator with XRE-family HTH domain